MARGRREQFAGERAHLGLRTDFLGRCGFGREQRPERLQWRQPATPVIETLRGLLMGTPIGDSGWLAVVWCAGITAASVALAAVLFRRRAA